MRKLRRPFRSPIGTTLVILGVLAALSSLIAFAATLGVSSQKLTTYSTPTAIVTPAPPSVSYSATGSPVTTNNSDNCITVNYPSGTVTNDLVLLVLVNNAQQTSDFAHTACDSTGWTQLADPNTNSPSQFEYQVWYHVVASGETSVTLRVLTSAAGATAWVVRYHQASGTPALATAAVQSGTATAATTLTPGNVTTNLANATAISLVAIRAANTLSLSAAQSYTFENAVTSTPGSASHAFGIADQSVAASASTPTSPTWSQSGTAAQWAWITAAFT